MLQQEDGEQFYHGTGVINTFIRALYRLGELMGVKWILGESAQSWHSKLEVDGMPAAAHLCTCLPHSLPPCGQQFELGIQNVHNETPEKQNKTRECQPIK